MATCTIHSLFRGVCAIYIGEEDPHEKKEPHPKTTSKIPKKADKKSKWECERLSKIEWNLLVLNDISLI